MSSLRRVGLKSASVAVLLALASPMASAVCVPGTAPGGGQEPTLQYLMDQWLGTCAVGFVDDRVPEGADAVWQAPGGAAVTILIEVAGFASQNQFGLYDANNPNVFLPVFLGVSGSGANATITFTQNGSGGYDVTLSGGAGGSATFSSLDFGYYISTPQATLGVPTYYSNSALNPDGQDHLFAYMGNGSTFSSSTGLYSVPSALRGTTFASNQHLLAWEDLVNGGDRDYQDMVMHVSAVPLPGALGLLALGGLGFGAFARRRAAVTIGS